MFHQSPESSQMFAFFCYFGSEATMCCCCTFFFTTGLLSAANKQMTPPRRTTGTSFSPTADPTASARTATIAATTGDLGPVQVDVRGLELLVDHRAAANLSSGNTQRRRVGRVSPEEHSCHLPRGAFGTLF